MHLSPSDYLDLVAGLAWIDVLGGFGAWRTVLPLAGQPARLAGQFNLRRTYSEPVTEPAPVPPAPARADTASAPVPGDPQGCRGCGDERLEETGTEPLVAPVAPLPQRPRSSGVQGRTLTPLVAGGIACPRGVAQCEQWGCIGSTCRKPMDAWTAEARVKLAVDPLQIHPPNTHRDQRIVYDGCSCEYCVQYRAGMAAPIWPRTDAADLRQCESRYEGWRCCGVLGHDGKHMNGGTEIGLLEWGGDSPLGNPDE